MTESAKNMNKSAIRAAASIASPRGHQWPLRPEVRPQVLVVVHSVSPLRHTSRSYRNDHWVLDINQTPAGRVRIGGRRGAWYSRRAPTAHLYRPDVIYREDYLCQAGRLIGGGYIMFTGGEALGLDRCACGAGYARFEDPSGMINQLIHDAAGAMPGEAARLGAQAALWRAAQLLHAAQSVDRHTWRVGGDMDAAERTLVDRTDALLHAGLHRRLTLEGLARQLAVSPSTLTHEYRRLSGRTPMATLRRMRIELAKALLLKGAGLKTIAAETGFADAFHLSRTFSRMEGMSPRAYRGSA